MPALATKYNLTDRFLKSLKPAEPGKRPVYWDSQVPCFGVRLTDRGKKSFVVGKRPAGAKQLVWTLLGAYPVMSLKDARQAARAALITLSEGKSPRLERASARQREREDARRKQASLFAAIAEDYISAKLPKLRSGKIIAQHIHRVLIPALGDRPVREIRRREIITLVERIAASGRVIPGTRRGVGGGEHAARAALARLGAMFSWMLGRDLVDINPCVGIKKVDLLGEFEARTRTLTETELRWLWQAAEEEGKPYGVLIKLLLLTGQRLREIANMRWSEIETRDGDHVLTIPKERMKAKQEHSVPLTPKVVELLWSLDRWHGCDYVFSLSGSKPIGSFDRLKIRLDARIADYACGTILPWRLHDLRRTARTGLSEVDATPFIGELILAHTQKDVHAVYDLHKYDRQKRQALEAWEQKLLSIVGEPPPKSNNIVAFRNKMA